MKKKTLYKNILLFIPLLILIAISLLNMYTASTTINMYKSYLIKQSIWFILGFLVMFLITIIKPKTLYKYSKLLYILNIILLILVLIYGKNINGSKAWFNFKFFSFQPSELMKFSLALYLSNIIAKIKNNSFKSELKVITKAIFIALIPSIFVFLEPDTGAIIIYLMIMLGIIFAYKINFKWYILFFIIALIFLGSFSYLYFFNKDLLIKMIGSSFFYRVDRILSFINKDSFQLDRALITIGNAKLFGKSNSVYIPESPTDFIIAFSIGNYGIISFIIILLCFIIMDIYFFKKFFKLRKLQDKLFISGFILMFIFAQVENIGMNLGILPIIGLPLPFLSYGGTNIIVYFIFLSIIINAKN